MLGRNVAVQVPGINAWCRYASSIMATVGFPAAGVENEPVKAGSRGMRAA
jgi:hypothetical protein